MIIQQSGEESAPLHFPRSGISKSRQLKFALAAAVFLFSLLNILRICTIHTSIDSNGTDAPLSNKVIKDDELEACRVVIENYADYHHEIIESVIHSYPRTTPYLDTKNCSKAKPVIYDFALINARFGKYPIATVTGAHPKRIEDTEFYTWKKYMERRLQNRTFERDDGRLVTYGEFIAYDDYNNRRVNMIIDVSCDNRPDLQKFLRRSDGSFCVHHGDCKNCSPLAYNRTCFVSPVMWPQSTCSFFPTKLPQFSQKELESAREHYAGDNESRESIRVCALGSGRNHSEMATLFAALPGEKYNAHFHVSVRNMQFYGLQKRFYRGTSLEKETRVNFIMEKDYEGFAKWSSTCDMIFLGIDPKSTPEKFPPSVVGSLSEKKLSDPLPLTVAYRIPTVVHEEFEKLYHGYFRGPVGVYNDTFESKVEAMTLMLKRIDRVKTE